jgi:putative sigma-54 modulation protein
VQINVSTRHGHLSPASQSKITSKVSRLKRYFDRLTALNVTVDLGNKALPAVEIVASAEHFHDLVSHERAAQHEVFRFCRRRRHPFARRCR